MNRKPPQKSYDKALVVPGSRWRKIGFDDAEIEVVKRLNGATGTGEAPDPKKELVEYKFVNNLTGRRERPMLLERFCQRGVTEYLGPKAAPPPPEPDVVAEIDGPKAQITITLPKAALEALDARAKEASETISAPVARATMATGILCKALGLRADGTPIASSGTGAAAVVGGQLRLVG